MPRNRNGGDDFDMDLDDFSPKSKEQNLAEASQKVKKLTEQFQKSAQYADEIQESLQKGNSEAQQMSENMLRNVLGAERLSKQLGHANDQIMDFTKSLTSIKQKYNEIGLVGKQWLSASNFKRIYEGYESSIKSFKGVFLTSYKKMNEISLTVANNMSNLGSQNFDSLNSEIKQLDERLIEAGKDIALMGTKESFGKAILDISEAQGIINLKLTEQKDIKQKIRKATEMALSMQNVAKNKVVDLVKQEAVKLMTVTEEIKRQKDIINEKNNLLNTGRIGSEQQIKDAGIILSNLKKQRDLAYDMNILQNDISQKLKPIYEAYEKIGDTLDTTKNKLSGIVREIGLQIPGISDAIASIDIGNMMKPLQKSISQTTMAFALGFKNIKTSGKIQFKALAKDIKIIFSSVIKGLFSLFKGLFIAILAGGLALIGGLFFAALSRNTQLQDAFNSAQSSSNALMGENADFKGIYQALGGLYGGQKISQLYSVMRQLKDVTVETAKAVQILQRNFSISATQSSNMLQNMRYIYGLSQKQSNQTAIAVAKMAVANNLQPTKVFQQLSNLSGDVVAHFGGSEKHLIRSLFFAKRLNMTMQQMARTAQGLSDIEGTIQKTLAVQALTGQEIDIGQMLRLNYSDKPEQAMAMIFEKFGRDFQNQSFIAKKEISGAFSMDPQTFATAANSYLNLGVPIQKVLEDIGNQSEKIGDKNKNAFGGINTNAYKLWNTLEEINKLIKESISKAFLPSIQKLLILLPELLPFIQRIIKRAGKITFDAFIWLSIPANQKRVVDTFKTIQKAMNTSLTVFEKFAKVLGWIYSKGGIIGLLGAALLVKTLFSLPALIIQFTQLAATLKLLKLGTAGLPGTGPTRWGAMPWDNASKLSREINKNPEGIAGKYSWRNKATGQMAKAPSKLTTGVAGVSVVGGLIAGFSTYAADKGRTDLDDKEKTGRAIGSGIGATALGMIGGIFGGPFGAMLGSSIGGWIGKNVGQAMSGGKTTKVMSDFMLQKIGKPIADFITNTITVLGMNLNDFLSNIKIYIQNIVAMSWNGIKGAGIEMWNDIKMVVINMWEGIKVLITNIWGKIMGGLMTAIIPLILLFDKGNNDESTINFVKAANSYLGSAGASGYDINKQGNAIIKLARGGIVTSPTVSLVGQSGPQAIIPLRDFAKFESNNIQNTSTKNEENNKLIQIMNLLQKLVQQPINISMEIDGQKVGNAIADRQFASTSLG